MIYLDTSVIAPLFLPDALHIAIAARLGAKILTFDSRMAEAASMGSDATP